MEAFIEKVADYAARKDDKYLYDMARRALFELQDSPNKPPGRFEELTEEEQSEIQDDGFDKFFKNLSNNFNLKTHFPGRFELQTIKNLLHHAWNANKKHNDLASNQEGGQG